ncbi:tetratricopeptide repeat protein [Actinophytocola sp.]|uniref:tetratricopeptide repeat protein n=1 Tax=Actinophytocola sp. TaxID=1872138 RepID=UPI002ED4A52C
MLRAWQDVIVKWRFLPDGRPMDRSQARLHTRRGRSALLAGRLDEALAEFEAASSLSVDPLDRVGIGDVYLARGGWKAAEEHYRAALRTGGLGALLAQLGLAQVQIGRGNAAGAVADLELLVADRPDDPMLRFYLASAWYSAAEQCRSRTAEDVLVITSEEQLRLCEDAGRRILALRTGDEELERGASQLLAEVAAGRRWTWSPEGIAVSLAVLTVALGLMTVVAGGLLHNLMLVFVGALAGSALLYGIVHRFRRQNWRRHADEMAPEIVKPGI